jgi:hypothetical protein
VYLIYYSKYVKKKLALILFFYFFFIYLTNVLGPCLGWLRVESINLKFEKHAQGPNSWKELVKIVCECGPMLFSPNP